MGHKCCGRKKVCDGPQDDNEPAGGVMAMKGGKPPTLVGQPISAYEGQANVRVMRKDGQDLVGTAEFKPSRINVEVTNGIITKILNNG